MENRRFGVTVKVNDLERCRAFYQELLGLGEPEADSGFSTVFSLPGGMSLTLLSCSGAYLEHENSATGWLFEPADIELTMARLRGAGFGAVLEKCDGYPGGLYRSADPEGNVFFLAPGCGEKSV